MKKLLLAATLIGAEFMFAPANEMPLSSGAHNDLVTTVAGGCGPGFHRGPYGGCRPNGGPIIGRACPRGFHLGPYGRRCVPNRSETV